MKLITCLVLVAASALLAACGGDDESSSEPLTKAEFLTQGNAICAEANKEIGAAIEEIPSEPDEAQLESFTSDTFVPNIQGQLDDLGDLGPPEGDEEKVDAIIGSAQEALDKVEDDPSLLLSNDDPFNESYDLAENYGLEECAG